MSEQGRVTRRELVRRGSMLGAGVALAGPVASFGAGAAAAATRAGGDALARGRKQGYLKLAFISDKPLSYIDDQGHLTGSGVAVAGAILKKLGIPKIEAILVDFNAMIPGLLAKRWDMSAFPFYITPERCAQVAFTNPMAQYREGALVKKGNPLKIHSYSDLAANSKIRVAIVAGDAETDWAKQAGVKSSQISLFPKEALAVEAVRIGRADAYLNAEFAIVQDMRNYGAGQLALAKPFKGPIVNGKEVIAYGGWAMRHEDVALLNAFNVQLSRMIKSGQLIKLEAPFGYKRDTLPPKGLTAKDLCPDSKWGAGYKTVK